VPRCTGVAQRRRQPSRVGSGLLAFLSKKSRIRVRKVLLPDSLGSNRRALLDKQIMAARKLAAMTTSPRKAVIHEIHPTTVRRGRRCSWHGVHVRNTCVRRP
jgi:hypothetical protein